MKTILLLLAMLLFSPTGYAIGKNYLAMVPDRAYMSFALTKFLSWHQKEFPGRAGEMKDVSKELVQELLSEVDHWLVPGHSRYYQFTIGHGLDQERRLFQTFRLYIHPSKRESPLIRKELLPENFEPWFLEWDDAGVVCYIGKRVREKTQALDQVCKRPGDKTYQARHREYFTEEMTSDWPNPFPFFSPGEIRFMKGDKIDSILYHTESAHSSGVPKELLRVVNKHTIDALFPLDRYRVDADGQITIYYP